MCFVNKRKISKKKKRKKEKKLKTPKRATTTLKITVRKQKVVALKRPPPFTLKVPVHVSIVRTLMRMGH